ncbi:hypothetical protein VIN01S_21160 [Vibrio inusitatus NBRC 102082]|uniref:Uncharacterized protein n=1 Tax=Vibrio inusitatus NBRC 102082 TaxID=1219070 RepID=A0A4Y3HX83_9VIBR|nr:hypothetical protein [Vibrio inusitatus]GEA51312.1 hypothetical protein VIN01S_21160 [Vibrio inusitatus NBRC 102082]
MIISQPIKTKKNGLIFYSVTIDRNSQKKELWYSVEQCYEELLTDTLDPFLIALIIPAMSEGENIHLKGKVSKELLFNSSAPLQEVIKVVIPSLKNISIKADEETISDRFKAQGVATGFSAGIDSFSVLADHHYPYNTNFKLTHLLFNNVGSHGKGGEELFNKRYKNLAKITETIGLPLIKVNSNLDSFYKENLYFKQTHTFRNASVGLLLQKGIGTFMYASAYHFKDCSVEKSNDTSKTDPITLPLISTNDINLISVGNEYTRAEKTKFVSGISDSYEFLDVCVSSRKRVFVNCGQCSKCLRTLVTLEIYGVIDHYSKVFDICAYKKNRTKYLMLLLGKRDPMSLEILKLANKEGFKFPVLSSAGYYVGISYFYSMVKLLRKYFKEKKRAKNSNLQ